MSTRANIIIKEGSEKLFFYRHSDGYPECTMPSLNIFLKWLKDGKIRADVMQGSAWLILLGAMEYNTIPKFETKDGYAKIETISDPADWKAGAYEPTLGIHGDIEFLYIIDLSTKTIKCYSDWTDEGVGKKQVNISKYALA